LFRLAFFLFLDLSLRPLLTVSLSRFHFLSTRRFINVVSFFPFFELQSLPVYWPCMARALSLSALIPYNIPLPPREPKHRLLTGWLENDKTTTTQTGISRNKDYKTKNIIGKGRQDINPRKRWPAPHFFLARGGCLGTFILGQGSVRGGWARRDVALDPPKITILSNCCFQGTFAFLLFFLNFIALALHCRLE